MFDTQDLTPDQLLSEASQLVESAAFDMAVTTPVDIVARLIMISAELQKVAQAAARVHLAKSVNAGRFSDA